MTLGFYTDYTELFRGAVLHWTGVSETNLGFPTLPDGVTVTPAGTWSNPLDLGTNKTLKTFNGSTNYISLTDNAAWDFWDADFSVCGWLRFSTVSSSNQIFAQQYNASNLIQMVWHQPSSILIISAQNSGSWTFYYSIPFNPNIGSMYHITVIRSGSTCLIYANGVSQTVTVNTAWTGTNTIAAPFVIGTRAGYFMNGNIKDFMIFTRALSQAEIMLIMRKTNPASGQDNFYPTLSGIRGVE